MTMTLSKEQPEQPEQPYPPREQPALPRTIGPAVTQWQARPFAQARGVSRAAPPPTPRRGTPRGKKESIEPRRQRRVCPRDKKASGDRRIDVRRCARVIADKDGHSLPVSNRSLQGSRQTGDLRCVRACVCDECLLVFVQALAARPT